MLINNVIVVSDDCIVFRIVIGWVVVVSLGSYDCWSGDKAYFLGILVLRIDTCMYICISERDTFVV